MKLLSGRQNETIAITGLIPDAVGLVEYPPVGYSASPVTGQANLSTGTNTVDEHITTSKSSSATSSCGIPESLRPRLGYALRFSTRRRLHSHEEVRYWSQGRPE